MLQCTSEGNTRDGANHGNTQTGDSVFLARASVQGSGKKRKAYILCIRRRFEHGSDTATPHCLETSHGSILISESVV